jgi:hypothetical protein
LVIVDSFIDFDPAALQGAVYLAYSEGPIRPL